MRAASLATRSCPRCVPCALQRSLAACKHPVVRCCVVQLQWAVAVPCSHAQVILPATHQAALKTISIDELKQFDAAAGRSSGSGPASGEL